MTNQIVTLHIDNVEVRQDADGRYCLNDLHRAAGGVKKDVPGNWLRMESAKALAAEVEKTHERPFTAKQGIGTFAVKELTYAYAAWLGGPKLWVDLVASIDSLGTLVRAIQDFEVPDDLPDMYVYAIREKDTGNVKLGISRDPHARLKQLQTGNASPLELVAYRKAENRFADERTLHTDASKYRIRGEWFDARAVGVWGQPNTTGFDPDSLPLPWLGADAQRALFAQPELC